MTVKGILLGGRLFSCDRSKLRRRCIVSICGGPWVLPIDQQRLVAAFCLRGLGLFFVEVPAGVEDTAHVGRVSGLLCMADWVHVS